MQAILGIDGASAQAADADAAISHATITGISYN